MKTSYMYTPYSLAVYHAGTAKRTEEFGGGLGVRWVSPELWAAEAGSPSRSLPCSFGPIERAVLLRNLRSERSFR